MKSDAPLKVGDEYWVHVLVEDQWSEYGPPRFTTKAGGEYWNKPVKILSLDHQKGLAIFEGIPARCKRKRRGVIRMEFLSKLV